MKAFFAGLRQKLFDLRTNREIFDRIMPHLQKEKDYAYPFATHDEMIELTRELDPSAMLSEIEGLMARMPKGYGRAFRYLLRRDLCRFLKAYRSVAEERMNPEGYDPRSVAIRAVPS